MDQIDCRLEAGPGWSDDGEFRDGGQSRGRPQSVTHALTSGAYVLGRLVQPSLCTYLVRPDMWALGGRQSQQQC